MSYLIVLLTIILISSAASFGRRASGSKWRRREADMESSSKMSSENSMGNSMNNGMDNSMGNSMGGGGGGMGGGGGGGGGGGDSSSNGGGSGDTAMDLPTGAHECTKAKDCNYEEPNFKPDGCCSYTAWSGAKKSICVSKCKSGCAGDGWLGDAYAKEMSCDGVCGLKSAAVEASKLLGLTWSILFAWRLIKWR